jgi:hypothetical protein
MNKPITPNKFATDLWGMMQMAIDEAVAAEREACAKVCDELFADVPPYSAPDCAAAIRARGQA